MRSQQSNNLKKTPRARARAAAEHASFAQGEGLVKKNEGGCPLPSSAPDNAADKPAAAPIIQHNTQSADICAKPGSVDLSLADTVLYCANTLIAMCDNIKNILGFVVKNVGAGRSDAAPTPPDLKKSKNPKNTIKNRKRKMPEEFVIWQ